MILSNIIMIPRRFVWKVRGFRYRDLFWELSLFLRAPFAKQPETKFIIYGSARTGTTICLSLLSKHPDLVAEHEILNAYHAQSKKDFNELYSTIGLSHTPPLFFPNRSIENVAAIKCKTANRKFYCFKLLSGQLEPEEERAFMHKRIASGWKVIHVRRDNLLEVAISYYIAFSNLHDSSSWFGAKSKRTHIEPSGLIDLLNRFESELNEQTRTLENQPHLSLVYENDYLDSARHQKVCDDIFEYLGMPNSTVSSTLEKQGAKVVSDRVENWDEVQRELEKTKFKLFLAQL